MQQIADAPTVEEFDFLVAQFARSLPWTSNAKLADYFTGTWLKYKKQWAACYRQVFHNSHDTNNIQESMNNVWKSKFTKNRGDQRLDSLLIVLWEKILPYYTLKYHSTNLKSVW